MQIKSFLIQKNLPIPSQKSKRYIESKGKYIYINHSEVTLSGMVSSVAVYIKIY